MSKDSKSAIVVGSGSNGLAAAIALAQAGLEVTVYERNDIIGGLRPGMVATKLITEQYEGHPEEWRRAERIFNILSDRVETVTPWLVSKILSNKKNGVRIEWLSKWKVFIRFLTSPFHKHIIFS